MLNRIFSKNNALIITLAMIGAITSGVLVAVDAKVESPYGHILDSAFVYIDLALLAGSLVGALAAFVIEKFILKRKIRFRKVLPLGCLSSIISLLPIGLLLKWLMIFT